MESRGLKNAREFREPCVTRKKIPKDLSVSLYEVKLDKNGDKSKLDKWENYRAGSKFGQQAFGSVLQ